jgi:hypothetical protein
MGHTLFYGNLNGKSMATIMGFIDLFSNLPATHAWPNQERFFSGV